VDRAEQIETLLNKRWSVGADRDQTRRALLTKPGATFFR
jgi:hypothetical protein